MRITGGQFKGRILQVPRGIDLRPTTERAREGLMAMLQHRVELEGLVAFELFSGTGAVSWELASRGAERIVSIEANRKLHAFQQSVVQLLPAPQVLTTLARAEAWLPAAANRERGTYQLAFADPPYEWKALPTLPGLLMQSGLVSPGGLIVIEHRHRYRFASGPNQMVPVEERAFGEALFSFFEVPEADLDERPLAPPEEGAS